MAGVGPRGRCSRWELAVSREGRLKFDEIGYWSEIKIEIVRKYAEAFSTIFSAKRQARFQHVYVDAFAGAGLHFSRSHGKPVPGSPLATLEVQPPFREYHFIDLDGGKLAILRDLIGDRSDVHLYEGDCNNILIEEVFPRVRYEDYRRGLCLLDPYGLHLKWGAIEKAGKAGTIDLLLNFPIADMNRNVIWRNPEGVDPHDVERMDKFWGDHSWYGVAYETTPGLFGPMEEKAHHTAIVWAFRSRLKDVAGFPCVAEPLPMRNSRRAVVYYLFFASQKPVAVRIVEQILKRYREEMA